MKLTKIEEYYDQLKNRVISPILTTDKGHALFLQCLKESGANSRGKFLVELCLTWLEREKDD